MTCRRLPWGFDLYRKQVIKQADLVLALFLRAGAFSADEKRRDFDYYEGVTARDSSLSAGVQSIVAAEVGHLELAHDYLAEAAVRDLHDLEHDIRDGLHIASLASAVLAVIAGLGGLRDDGAELSFAPRLPRGIARIAFRVAFCGNTLRVEVTPSEASYSPRNDGEPLNILHWGEPVHLAPGTTATIPPLDPLPAPEQPSHRAPASRKRRSARSPEDNNQRGSRLRLRSLEKSRVRRPLLSKEPAAEGRTKSTPACPQSRLSSF